MNITIRNTKSRSLDSRLRVIARALVVVAAMLPLATQVAKAQTTTDSCVVSVLNQTAAVQPNGQWAAFNVPANMGPIRARMVCTEAGATRAAASQMFRVVNGRMSAIEPLTLGVAPPTPARLVLAPIAAPLTSAGETTQLATTVFFADGSSENATLGASGTTYASTNPAIAEVSADGLVTARASGRALVTALHEAILASVLVDVQLSGDSDGDGIPDDLELANGLDPNDPNDALEDLDGDGLINRRELVEFGTALRNPDTDGDGLLDGEEVVRYGTNPLLRDTDGDLISDRLEILSGSDPLDPLSFNLGPILANFEVLPGRLDLVFDTVVGEASRRLTVRGTLIDGTVLDLRTRYGTTYSSADLTIASFGTEEGRIFAGAAGSTTVTVTNSGRSVAVPVTVTRFAPAPLTSVYLPGFANGIVVRGVDLFIASGSAGLLTFDVSEPSVPRFKSRLPLPGNANDVRVEGDTVYVASGTAGLSVIDVSNRSAPVLLGQADTAGDATDVTVETTANGTFAYVADGMAGLAVVDVTVPVAPVVRGVVDTPGRARGVDSEGDFVVVADSTAGVSIIDVFDPDDPFRVGSTATRANGISAAADVAVRGRIAYVADGEPWSLGGVRTIDFSTPSTPVLVGSTTNGFGLTGIALDDGFAVTSDTFFVNAVPIFEISDPRAPTYISLVEFRFSGPDDNGNGIAAQDGISYMVGSRWQLEDNGVFGDTRLWIGRYRSLTDDLGVAPTVTITAPTVGQEVRERKTLSIRATATDDVRVSSVEFLLDGESIGSDFRAPYQLDVMAPLAPTAPGPHVLTVRAVDLGANVGEDSVTFELIPDADPTVALVSPNASVPPTEGRTISLTAVATDDRAVASVEFRVDGAFVGTAFGEPYVTSFTIPLGTTSLAVEAIATDDVGQTASSQVVLPVLPDAPPTAAIANPGDGTPVVEGLRLRVSVVASDDVGIQRVDVLNLTDGSSVTRSAPPYEFVLNVPAGETEMQLVAQVTDSIGQVALSDVITLPIAPDPGTTVVGKVVDSTGEPIDGAQVDCLGETTTADLLGEFSVPGVPTGTGDIVCGATAVGSSGETISGTSAPQLAIPDGITAVGNITLSAALLYASAAQSPGDNTADGRLYIADRLGATGHLVPVSDPVDPAGLHALAFDESGGLYAIANGNQIFAVGANAAAKSASKGRVGVPPSGSALLRIDPDTGEVLEEIGTVIDFQSEVIPRIVDLAWNEGELYGIGERDFFDGQAIYRIDPTTAEADRLATVPVEGASIAPAGPGQLWVFGYNYFVLPSLSEGSSAKGSKSGTPRTRNERGALLGAELDLFDIETGTLLSIEPIDWVGEIKGLTRRPGSERLSFLSSNELLDLDPATFTVTPAATLDGAIGRLMGLDFRTVLPESARTTIVGRTVDSAGEPLPNIEVSTFGASTFSASDGRFEFDNLGVPTTHVRVVAYGLEGDVLSAAVPRVPNGTTDLGDLEAGGFLSCAHGTLAYEGCLTGPVQDPVDVYRQLFDGSLVFEAQMFPAADGNFCLPARRGAVYLLRRQDLECGPMVGGTCETTVSLVDPPQGPTCGDATSCEDLGPQRLFCDFFGGS